MTPAATPTSLDPLIALDSPLLDGLAPELADLRARATAAAALINNPQGCSSCARGRANRELTAVAIDLAARLAANPALVAVFPALLTSAKQATDHV